SMGNFDPAAFNIVTTGFANVTAGSFSVTSNDGGGTMSLVYTPTPVAALPQVLSVTPNGNVPALIGSQLSRVVSVAVVFDQAVLLDTYAMMLSLHTNNVSFNGVLQPNGVGVLPTSLKLATTDNIIWTVTFIGNTDDGLDGFNSLKDGVYDLNIDAAKV